MRSNSLEEHGIDIKILRSVRKLCCYFSKCLGRARFITMSSPVLIERLQNVHIKVGGEKKALRQTKLVVSDRGMIESTFSSPDGYVSYVELSGIKGGDYKATATVFCANDCSWSEYDVPSVAGKITFRVDNYAHCCNVVVNGSQQQFTVVLYFPVAPDDLVE
ncbi:ORF131 [Spodoptera frugiperda granulovirus]|uniref:ORF131 n=1 Tax=Spodoptera frugiperda granulovirus TaxID=307454 RepID=A0A0C5ASI3_9BBAC|nr:ORF131 [Spodoptera frugiperda granulovirus]AJK91792.1 ORF131 [Spodoptera frugiperda granulovirus]AXS01156.1 ORF136 [Spodoptera frugiperda granulovirus]